MEAASIEELNQKISTLEKEKNKEEEYRNYMQLERVHGTPCIPLFTKTAFLGQNQCFLGNHKERSR